MSFKGNWARLKDSDLFELITVAKENYPGFKELPESFISKIFKKYKKTTLVFIQRTQIKGFVVYQEWTDALNFIMIFLPFSKEMNLKTILRGRSMLPNNKKIVWWDDERMEGRGLCR